MGALVTAVLPHWYALDVLAGVMVLVVLPDASRRWVFQRMLVTFSVSVVLTIGVFSAWGLPGGDPSARMSVFSSCVWLWFSGLEYHLRQMKLLPG